MCAKAVFLIHTNTQRVILSFQDDPRLLFFFIFFFLLHYTRSNYRIKMRSLDVSYLAAAGGGMTWLVNAPTEGEDTPNFPTVLIGARARA